MATLPEWAVATAFAATFFVVVPRIMSRHADFPPIIVAVAFPAVAFGVTSIFRYFGRIER